MNAQSINKHDEGIINVMIFTRLKLLIILIWLSIFGVNHVQAQSTQHGLMLFPFTINGKMAEPLLQKMISDMLFSRLNSEQCMPVIDYQKQNLNHHIPVQEKDARRLAKENHLSHVLMGSVSIFGGHYSIDAQLWKVDDDSPFFTHSSMASSENDVIPKIHEMSIAIQNALCQNSFVQHKSHQNVSLDNLFTFQAFPPIDMEIQAIAVYDVNQDFRKDIIVSDNNSIYVYDLKDNQITIIGNYNANHACHVLRMDAGDLNHDQVPEILVTAINKPTGRLVSFVLEWKSNQLSLVLQDEPFYFRLFKGVDKPARLIAQKQPIGQFFSKKVFLMSYSQKKLIIEKAQAIPPDSNFASFHQGRFTGSQKDYVIIRPDNKLQLLDSSLRKKWISETRYAESKNVLVLPRKQAQNSSHDREKYCYLNQRIQVVDVDHDRVDEIILSEHNATTGGRLFHRYRQFQSGTITCLKWNGLGMIPLWKTPEINGYISDYMWFENNDGKTCIMVACVSRKLSMFEPVQSSLMLFELQDQ